MPLPTQPRQSKTRRRGFQRRAIQDYLAGELLMDPLLPMEPFPPIEPLLFIDPPDMSFMLPLLPEEPLGDIMPLDDPPALKACPLRAACRLWLFNWSTAESCELSALLCIERPLRPMSASCIRCMEPVWSEGDIVSLGVFDVLPYPELFGAVLVCAKAGAAASNATVHTACIKRIFVMVMSFLTVSDGLLPGLRMKRARPGDDRAGVHHFRVLVPVHLGLAGRLIASYPEFMANAVSASRFWYRWYVPAA